MFMLGCLVCLLEGSVGDSEASCIESIDSSRLESSVSVMVTSGSGGDCLACLSGEPVLLLSWSEFACLPISASVSTSLLESEESHDEDEEEEEEEEDDEPETESSGPALPGSAAGGI